MRSFLVSARFTMDDVALRLFTSREAALSWHPEDHWIDRAVELHGYDSTEFVCFALTEFDETGHLVSVEILP